MREIHRERERELERWKDHDLSVLKSSNAGRDWDQPAMGQVCLTPLPMRVNCLPWTPPAVKKEVSGGGCAMRLEPEFGSTCTSTNSAPGPRSIYEDGTHGPGKRRERADIMHHVAHMKGRGEGGGKSLRVFTWKTGLVMVPAQA